MELLIKPTDYGRTRGDLPSLPIVNMFAEENLPEGKIILQSRPGLQQNFSYGTDPIKLLYHEPGTFSNDVFVVSGSNLYKEGALIGTIDGTGVVSADSFSTTMFITAGQSIYSYNGTTLAAVAFPDAAAALKLLVAAGRVVIIKSGTQRIYWSDVLSTTINALSFAEAENSPDKVLDMIFIGDTLLLFGEATTEFWTISGEANTPFVPIQGRVYPKGIKNTGAVAKVRNTFAWVTDNNQVCVGEPDSIISTREIEIDIASSTSVRLWTFYLDNMEFLALTTGTQTWIFQPETQMWSRFRTYPDTNWEVGHYAKGYFGSIKTGRTMIWNNLYEEGTFLERSFAVYAPMSTKPMVVNNITIRVNSGSTPFTTGAYANPTMDMRTSKDGGRTWGTARSATLGIQGQYRKFVRWLAAGLFSSPGVMIKFEITDPVPLRVSSVTINEPLGGF